MVFKVNLIPRPFPSYCSCGLKAMGMSGLVSSPSHPSLYLAAVELGWEGLGTRLGYEFTNAYIAVVKWGCG